MLICCRKCKTNIDDSLEQPLKCGRCHFLYHFPSCCDQFKDCPYKLMLGDTYFRFTCDSCIEGGENQLYRIQIGWDEIADIVENNFPEFGMADVVVANWARFFANEAEGEGWRGELVERRSLGKSKDKRAVEAVISPEGVLLPTPTSKIHARRHTKRSPTSSVPAPEESSPSTTPPISSTEPTLDQNPGSFDHEAGLLGFKSSKSLKRSLKKLATSFTFSNLDFDRPNPEHPITLSTAQTHSAQQLNIDVEKHGVKGEKGKGYAMARTTHGFDRGCWYFEVDFPIGSVGNIRIGLSQILGEAQAPVGYDEYSYAIRDKDGAVLHCGHERPYGKAFIPGSTIGIKLTLPSDPATALVSENLRVKIESEFKPKLLGAYKVKQDILAEPSESSVEFYIEGKSFGPAFTNIYRAKYYPAVSVYNGAEVILNFGPNFKYPLPDGAQPICNHDI